MILEKKKTITETVRYIKDLNENEFMCGGLCDLRRSDSIFLM
jgi:hypothetical protein